MKSKITKLLPLFTLLMLFACKSKSNKQDSIADTSITEKSSFNNLFLDSTAIESFLMENPDLKKYESQFLDFYKSRNYEFAWFDSTGIIEQSGNFINLINNSIAQSNDSSLYDPKLNALYAQYRKKFFDNHKITQEDIHAELYFTGQFFRYAAKEFKGADLDASQLGWFIPRKKISLTELLNTSLKGNQEALFNSLLNPIFKKLDDYLQKYLAIKKEHPQWTVINMTTPKLKLGDKNKTVRRLKNRLFLLGDLPAEDTTSSFDEPMEEAVKSYQQRMGLGNDGVVKPAFIRSINTPLDTLIRKILINRERARWLPPTIPATHIWVNIPEFRLHVYQDEAPLFDMRVIVGSSAHNTVIFSGNLKYIVFAPYWNVPQSIIKNEIIPGMARNSSYLANHNMKIFGRNKNGVPNDVRQLPGSDNALGSVKFLFPNDYDIYLHDTPNHDLFSSSNRGLSHGCIRLSNPLEMAKFLLHSDTDSSKYTEMKIDSLMHRNKEETWVTIKPTIPVYLVYFTTWVDDDGKLNFRNDIYGHDQKVADKLFK